jgi:NitT/TauT family transport system substrate-binding protein
MTCAGSVTTIFSAGEFCHNKKGRVTMKKVLFYGSIMLLLITLAAGCGSQSVKDEEKAEQSQGGKVRIANVVFPGGPPQGIVMINKGMLGEKLGGEYEVESILTRNIDQVSLEMKEEKYDFLFAYYGTIAEYASNMSDYNNGNNFVVIANISNGPGNRLVARSDIKNIKQLDGKTVGVFNRDYAAATLVANTLKENGLDIVERGGTVKLKQGNSVEILKELKAGKIEALMARPSFREPGFNTLVKPGEMAYGGAPPYQVLMVRKAYLKEHPEVVEKVLAAHIEATEWIKENRNETAEIVWTESEKYYKEKKIEKLMPPKPAMAEAYNKMLVDVYPNLQFLEDIWAYMEKYNARKPYAMEEVVDFTLLNKALEARGLPMVEEYNRQKEQ